jgi:hypothetical protein
MELIVNEKPLTPAERGRLQELELVIRDNFMAYVAVGSALLEIRENRLYRNDTSRTWEGYCRELWDMSHQRADQLIAAKNVAESLTTIVVKNDGSPDWELLPANEAQARELAQLEPADQVKVWRDLLDYKQATANTNRPFRLTARTVKAAVKEFKGELITEKTRKATKNIRERAKNDDRKSAQFASCFNLFMAQIDQEKDAGWRHTSRQAVFDSLCDAAQAVGYCGENTLKDKKVLWRGKNLEKLLAAGFAIYRISSDKMRIEQLESDGEWLVFGEFDTAEHGQEYFADLMLDPTSIESA